MPFFITLTILRNIEVKCRILFTEFFSLPIMGLKPYLAQQLWPYQWLEQIPHLLFVATLNAMDNPKAPYDFSLLFYGPWWNVSRWSHFIFYHFLAVCNRGGWGVGLGCMLCGRWILHFYCSILWPCLPKHKLLKSHRLIQAFIFCIQRIL